MKIEDTYYKLNKDYLQIITNSPREPRVLLILSFLYLIRNPSLNNNTYLSLNFIKELLNISIIKSSRENNINDKLIHDLDYLVQSKIISLKDEYDYNYHNNISHITDITEKKPFFLNMIEVEDHLDISSNYIKVLHSELFSIIEISKKNKLDVFKLFNIFIYIKSHIKNNTIDINICFLGKNTICDRLDMHFNTISKYINFLVENKLLYQYNLDSEELVSSLGNKIKYVYSIEQYEYKDVVKRIKKQLR